MKKIESLIFDMDGVLWKDEKPLVNLGQLFEMVNNHQINYAFATNNSTKTIEEYNEKLNNLGIPCSQDQIITSSTTLLSLLIKKFPSRGPVFIIGENGLLTPILKAGFHLDSKNAIAVIGGLDRKISYEKFKTAILLLQKEVDFYFTNADNTFPTPDGIVPGAGSILKALEVGSGRTAIVAGKPKATMFEFAMEYLGTSPDNTMVIGDRLDTDILGGINAKCPTALVLSGISRIEDTNRLDIHPNLIHNNIHDLITYLEQEEWMLN